MTTTVALVGATGRMGQLITGLIDESNDFELAASLDSRSALEAMEGADLVVDVTVPAVSQQIVEHALARGQHVLVGTSGWSADRIAALQPLLDADPERGIAIVPNFSIGSVLATNFAATAARYFDSVEIVEAHHAGKVDSPSGTAIRTAELMLAVRGELGPVAAPHVDQRARGQQVSSIPIHSLRLHGVVAKQDVIFGGTGELLTISHETLSPSSYEAGILLALRTTLKVRGIVVGLDKLIELDSDVE